MSVGPVDADCSHNVRRLNTDIIHHNHRTALDVCKGLDRDSPVRGGLNRVIDTNRANDLRKDARKGLKGTKSFQEASCASVLIFRGSSVREKAPESQ